MSYEAWGDGDPGPDWRDYALDHGWIDPVDFTRALLDVMNERERQMAVEGWTPEHDDEHSAGQIASAAASYALTGLWMESDNDTSFFAMPMTWPWERAWWKPTDRRRDLVKAGALILAEIERLDRLAADAPTPGEEQP